MIVDLEAQLLRDAQPLTRPTRWSHGGESFEPGKLTSWKLFPGAANNGEQVTVAVAHMGMVAPRWIAVQATISIDGITWPSPLPGQVYANHPPGWMYGSWSCVINYPIVSTLDTFKGVHTLLLRTIVTEDE